MDLVFPAVVEEFLELSNAGSVPVPLFDPEYPTNTWRLRDAVDFDFPPGTVIPAGGYRIIACEGAQPASTNAGTFLNLGRSLAAEGGFYRLGTSHNPESPTSWASFATGSNAGKHNIYDFLVRDFDTYMPDLLICRKEHAERVLAEQHRIAHVHRQPGRPAPSGESQ